MPGRRYDHLFFSIMALCMLATVFDGFSTHYLAGAVKAPLPQSIIHLHGAAFSCVLAVSRKTRWSPWPRGYPSPRYCRLLLAALMVILAFGGD
jgi:hypothetical protein